MITIVEGNILDAKENVIAQQVNCMGIIGSGLAKQIRNKYPEIFQYYSNFVINNGKLKCLGECQMVLVDNKKNKYVANLFGQYNYGRDKQPTDYDALSSALIKLKNYCKEFNLSISIPYQLGCGLAGGDWDIVYGIIEEVFNDYDATIYKLT